MVITTTDETTEAVIDKVETEEATTEANNRRANSTWNPSTPRHSPLLAERSNLHNETLLLFTSRLDYRRFFKTIIIRSLLTIYKLQFHQSYQILPLLSSRLYLTKRVMQLNNTNNTHFRVYFLHMTHGL